MRSESYRVLVIDPDGNVRTLLQLTFDQQGHQVLVTPDGAVGVTLAQVEQPDIILLDVDAAHRNGSDVYLDLQRNPQTAGIPVLIFSAAFTRGDRVAWRRMPNVVDAIVKPFEIAALLSSIDAVCATRRTRQVE